MALSSVAVVIPHRPAMFELGVVHEVFEIRESVRRARRDADE